MCPFNKEPYHARLKRGKYQETRGNNPEIDLLFKLWNHRPIGKIEYRTGQVELHFSTRACVYNRMRDFPIHLCHKVYSVDTIFLVQKCFPCLTRTVRNRLFLR